MDPDAALATVRAFINAARRATDENSAQQDMAKAIAAFEALDEWLSAGGFLPRSWEKARG